MKGYQYQLDNAFVHLDEFEEVGRRDVVEALQLHKHASAGYDHGGVHRREYRRNLGAMSFVVHLFDVGWESDGGGSGGGGEICYRSDTVISTGNNSPYRRGARQPKS